MKDDKITARVYLELDRDILKFIGYDLKNKKRLKDQLRENFYWNLPSFVTKVDVKHIGNLRQG